MLHVLQVLTLIFMFPKVLPSQHLINFQTTACCLLSGRVKVATENAVLNLGKFLGS